MPDTDNPTYTSAQHKDVAMDQVVAKNEATVVVVAAALSRLGA